MTPGEIVTSFIRSIEDKDLDGALALLTDDVEYDNVPMGKVHGRDAVRAGLAPFVAAFTTIDWVVHRQVAEGNLVMNERVDRFQKADGSWLEMPVAGIFVVREGRIALWRDYFDLATYQRQS